MNELWKEATFIGFDTETSGKYPLAAEVCEVAAVKWQNGKIVDSFESLICTRERMSDEVIAIHKITNEMLVGAPPMHQVIREFHRFIDDAYLIAHHAPFDLGFLAIELEKEKLTLPQKPAFCSSLLSRKAFTEPENHKLQTLIKFFGLNQGVAHRAKADAEACLGVALKVFEKIGENKTVKDILDFQNTPLYWRDYAMATYRSHPVHSKIIQAIEKKLQVQLSYSGGSKPGQPRTVYPLGVVCNPLDDYLVAAENLDEIPKRYFFKRIIAATL